MTLSGDSGEIKLTDEEYEEWKAKKRIHLTDGNGKRRTLTEAGKLSIWDLQIDAKSAIILIFMTVQFTAWGLFSYWQLQAKTVDRWSGSMMTDYSDWLGRKNAGFNTPQQGDIQTIQSKYGFTPGN